MADVIQNQSPARFIDPTEPYLVVGYNYADNQLAQFGRYLNLAGAGAAYDLTTPVGTPIIGPNGGLFKNDDAGSYRQGATYTVGNTSFHYRVVHVQNAAPTADRIVFINGVQHWMAIPAAGTPYFTPNNGGGISISPFSTVGRGLCCWDAIYSGGTLTWLCNGRQVDQDVIAAGVPAAGALAVGRHGEHLATKVYTATATVDQCRASYVREFAKRLKFSWVPKDVGEGPAGGILTGSTPGGYATCPSGAASMQFVWVNDLSAPGGGYLTLTDSGALSMRRIDIALTKQPMFGSWLIRYKLRNPVFGGDNPRIGLIGMPGADMTAAGSRSIWVESLNNGGGWWRTQVQRENAGLIGVDADIDVSVMGPGDDCATLLTHGVDGNFRVWAFSRMRGAWAWRAAAVVNDVNFLDYNWISIAPRGSYIKSVHAYQSEMDPHELGAKAL